MSTIHTVTVETAKELGLLPEEFEKIKQEEKILEDLISIGNK